MRANRGSDTQPEVALRSILHRRGCRFRKNLTVRAGPRLARPDIVFLRERVAVFVDGCFWHCCPRHATQPKANAAYWRPKLAANRARDRAVTLELRRAGWYVVRVWTHVAPTKAADMVLRVLAR
jgi:DNA mismatch endonuclease (patch repair protein)